MDGLQPEPLRASIESWETVKRNLPRWNAAEGKEIQIRAVPHHVIGEQMLNKLLDALRGDPLDQPINHEEGVKEVEQMAEGQGLKLPEQEFLIIGSGHGQLITYCDLGLDTEQITRQRERAEEIKIDDGLAYIIDSDLLGLGFEPRDSGFVSKIPSMSREVQVGESHDRDTTGTPNSVVEINPVKEKGYAHNDTGEETMTQWRQMEEELHSKTQELLHLQETIRRQEEEKEEINKLLESAKQHIEGQRSQDLSESRRTQSEVREATVMPEALYSERYRDQRINTIKSEDGYLTGIDRPPTPTPSMSVRSVETLEMEPESREPSIGRTRVIRRRTPSPEHGVDARQQEILYLRQLLQQEKLERKMDVNRLAQTKEENAQLRKSFEERFSLLEQQLAERSRVPPNTLSMIRSRLTPSDQRPSVIFDPPKYKENVGRVEEGPRQSTGVRNEPTGRKDKSMPRPVSILRSQNQESRPESEAWSGDEDTLVPQQPIFETPKRLPVSRNRTPSSFTHQKRFFPVTPKNFGLSIFDEDSGDLLTHIEEVNRCAEEAGEMGATEFQKIRLLMMSLPKEMKYVESFVPTAKKNEYKDFSEEVVKILSDKIRTVMNKFIDTQRGPGESILKYFNRITQMYKNSNALVGTDWEMDSGHVTGVYTKVYQALYDGEKNELDRRLDGKLENRSLTVCELKRELVDIHKLSSQKIRAEKVGNNRVLAVTEQASSGPTEREHKRRNQLSCYHCQEPGHLRNECDALKRQLASNAQESYGGQKQGHQRFNNESLFRKDGQQTGQNNWRPRQRTPWSRPNIDRRPLALPRKKPNQPGVRPAPDTKSPTTESEK